MPTEPVKQYRIYIYESVTYTYIVPPGTDPKDYLRRVEAGDVNADSVDSRTQGRDLYEVDGNGNPIREVH